jgi:hypothetical protein
LEPSLDLNAVVAAEATDDPVRLLAEESAEAQRLRGRLAGDPHVDQTDLVL